MISSSFVDMRMDERKNCLSDGFWRKDVLDVGVAVVRSICIFVIFSDADIDMSSP